TSDWMRIEGRSQIESCKGCKIRLQPGCQLGLLEIGLLQKLQLRNAREDVALRAVMKEQAQALQVLRIKRIINVLGQVLGNELGGQLESWRPRGSDFRNVFEAVVARLLENLSDVQLRRAILQRRLAHSPESKDECAAGPALPFLGHIVAKVAVCSPLQRRIANQQCSV